MIEEKERALENDAYAETREQMEGSLWNQDFLDSMRSSAPIMQNTLEQARLVADTDTTVLLTGETGTGKGVMARWIHMHSRRRNRALVSVHCGAIPEPLIESELFGHERGAFTGAVKRKQGRFEAASGGTIFLDEIGTITAGTQIKLLQVLQDRTYQPVGGEMVMEASARILAATNNDLEEMCRQGRFREDLFYRLNVFPIHMPPLRERREDIGHLLKVFLKRLNRHYAREVLGVDKEVEAAFWAYSWPGNIRELENLVERAYILEKGEVLGRRSFPQELFQQRGGEARRDLPLMPTLAEVRALAVSRAERDYLSRVLSVNRGRIDMSARDAGISTRQLHKLLTRYGLRKEDFKPGRG